MRKILFTLSFLAILSIQPLSVLGQKQKVILDCDLGSDIDDAYAMALLIASPELDILGIILDFDNTPKRAQVACRMLYEAGRENIPVIAGRKTGETYSRQFCWAEGFDKIQPVKEKASDFIIGQLKRFPGEIILLRVGPVANIADVLDKDPDALKLAKHVYSMFGSFYTGYNRSPIPSPEWNVRADISSAKKLVSSGARITYAGLDITGHVALNYDLIEVLNNRKTPLTDALVGLTSLWGLGVEPKPAPKLFDPEMVAMVIWP